MAVRTDLHTHFAGILSPDELIDLGIEHHISLDVATAKRLQVVNAGYSGGPLPLSSLNETQMTKLKAGLELAQDKQSLFDELDEVYANRAFITKNENMFVPLIEKIAHSYGEQGVKYAELSYAGIIDNPQLVKALHDNVPQIERETGVKIRFLGALWRHSDQEWNMDEADRLKGVLQSPYVVGIDVMGHEKNPIRDLKDPLQEVIEYAAQNIPGCVIRMHAGENPYYSAEPSTIDDYNFNNAFEAVQITDSARRGADGEIIGPYGQDMQIRIGHGRYGLHPDTLRLIAQTGAISELCLSSNKLLNHADDFRGPFNLYADHGVSFVLGSDGYGLYSTSPPNEETIALGAGMTPEAHRMLKETEDAVLAEDHKRFQEKTAAWDKYAYECTERGVDPFKALSETTYSTPDGKPRWDAEITAAKQKADQESHDTLVASLEGEGINADADVINYLLQERNVLMFSGASKSSWKTVPEDQQKKIIDTMKTLVDNLDGRVDIVVTGGTDFGFEAIIHRLIEERNKDLPKEAQIAVVGALTTEVNLDDIRPGTVSHAVILEYGDGFAKSWMDQPSALMDMALRTNAKVIMAGGGQVIRDMIVDADGRGLIKDGKILLFEGINGASGEKAHDYPQAKFHSANKLLKLLSGNTSSANSAQRVAKSRPLKTGV